MSTLHFNSLLRLLGEGLTWGVAHTQRPASPHGGAQAHRAVGADQHGVCRRRTRRCSLSRPSPAGGPQPADPRWPVRLSRCQNPLSPAVCASHCRPHHSARLQTDQDVGGRPVVVGQGGRKTPLRVTAPPSTGSL